MDGEHIVTSSTNRPIREPSLLPLVEKDDFRIDSGTAPSEIHTSHIVLEEDHFRIDSGTAPSEIHHIYIVFKEDDFGIDSGTDPSKIYDIYSSRRITL